MHPAWRAVLVAAVLGLLLPIASGQALDPVVSVDADPEQARIPYDEAQILTWTIRNDGPASLTVSLAMELEGPWATDFADRYSGPFLLASGAVRVLPVRVTSTTQTTESLPDGLVGLTAIAQDDAGRTARDRFDVALSYGPAPLPVLPPPDHTLRNSLLAGGAALILIVAGYVALGRLVTVRPSVRELALLPERAGWVRVEVRNRAPWSHHVRVRLRADPAQVLATTDTDRVLVGPRSHTAVSVHVRHHCAAPSLVVLEARVGPHRWSRRASVRVTRNVAAPSPFETTQALGTRTD